MLQSNGARAGVAVVSVAVLVILLVALSGGDDDTPTVAGDTTTQEITAPATAENDGSGEIGNGGEPNKPDKPNKPKKDPEPKLLDIEVEAGEPVDGVADLEYSKGDEISFLISSPDTSDEIHVHGYDLYYDLEAGDDVKVDFPADLQGVFEIELHGTGNLIAQLTVK